MKKPETFISDVSRFCLKSPFQSELCSVVSPARQTTLPELFQVFVTLFRYSVKSTVEEKELVDLAIYNLLYKQDVEKCKLPDRIFISSQIFIHVNILKIVFSSSFLILQFTRLVQNRNVEFFKIRKFYLLSAYLKTFRQRYSGKIFVLFSAVYFRTNMSNK